MVEGNGRWRRTVYVASRLAGATSHLFDVLHRLSRAPGPQVAPKPAIPVPPTMLVGQRPSNRAGLLEVNDRDVFVVTVAEILDNRRIVGDVMAVKAHIAASGEPTANTVPSAS